MCCGGGEAGHDVGAGYAPIRASVQQVSGAIVVQDLHAAAVGQCPVGEIRLPAFVGLLDGKAAVRAFGAFAGRRGHQAVVVQDAPDGRG